MRSQFWLNLVKLLPSNRITLPERGQSLGKLGVSAVGADEVRRRVEAFRVVRVADAADVDRLAVVRHAA